MMKRPNGGLAISISGCSDDQKSADASVCPAPNQNSVLCCRNSSDEMRVSDVALIISFMNMMMH